MKKFIIVIKEVETYTVTLEAVDRDNAVADALCDYIVGDYESKVVTTEIVVEQK